jgi:succinate dehydrogenase/fumarate reductase flavoprotein subunit
MTPHTPELVARLIAEAPGAIDFLEQPRPHPLADILASLPLSDLGLPTTTASALPAAPPLALPILVALGGHSSARTHRPAAMPVGFALVKTMTERLKAGPYARHVDLVTGVRVVGLMHNDDGAVTGVKYAETNNNNNTDAGASSSLPPPTHYLPAAAVLLASGGLTASPALPALAPQLAALHLPMTSGEWASGDAIEFTKALHPHVAGPAAIQVHPTGFVDPANPDAKSRFLAPEALRGSGGKLVGPDGREFVDELDTRDVVARAIHWLPGGTAGLVLDEDAAKRMGPAMKFYQMKKLFIEINNPDNEVDKLNVSVQAALKLYGDDADALCADVLTHTDNFKELVSKSSLPPADTPASPQCASLSTWCAFRSILPEAKRHIQPCTAGPLVSGRWLAAVGPVLHYSMGGLATDARTRVLSEDDKPIAGLFAAGEAAAGVHGANRLGGNSLLECTVFGQVAGKEMLAGMVKLLRRR